MNKDKKNTFPFTVEGKHFDSIKEKLTAKSIIEQAKEKNILAVQDSIDKLTLKGEKEVYYLDDLVDLSQDNRFAIGVKTYQFKVNGQKLETTTEKLLSLQIIKEAQEKGVFLPDKVENLLLESVGEKQKSFKLDDLVDLSQYNNFILGLP